MTFSFFRESTSQKQICTTNDKPSFFAGIFGAARTPVDARNICLSEPLRLWSFLTVLKQDLSVQDPIRN